MELGVVDDTYATALCMAEGATRLKLVKWALKNIEPEVVSAVASWRRQQRYEVANLMADKYLTGCQFASLKGLKIEILVDRKSAQVVAVEYIMRMLKTADIVPQKDGRPAKVSKNPMNAEKAEGFASLLKEANVWFESKKQEYNIEVSCNVLFHKLMRRVLINNEAGLLEKFDQHLKLKQTGSTSMPGEFKTLLDQLECKRSQISAAADQERLRCEGEEAEKAAARDAKAPNQMVEEGSSKDLFGMCAAGRSDEASGLRTSEPQQQALNGEKDAVTEDEDSKTVAAEVDALASADMSGAFTIIPQQPEVSTWLPSELKTASPVLWLLPAPTYKRGRVEQGTGSILPTSLRLMRVGIKENDSVLVVLGHDPCDSSDVKAKLRDLSGVLEKFRWKIPVTPLIQDNGEGRTYTEYVMVGIGPKAKDLDNPSWDCIMRVLAFPENSLIIRQCGCGQQGASTRSCGVVQSFCKAFMYPQEKNRAAQQQDGSKSDDSDDEVAPPGEDGTAMDIDEEDYANEDDVGDADGTFKALRKSYTNGLHPDTVKLLIEKFDASVVVLAPALAFHTGFLAGTLAYNAERVTLGGCTMIVTAPPIPDWQDGAGGDLKTAAFHNAAMCFATVRNIWSDRQTDRQTERQSDGQADRQTKN